MIWWRSASSRPKKHNVKMTLLCHWPNCTLWHTMPQTRANRHSSSEDLSMSYSRRDFLRSSAATVAGLSAARLLSADEKKGQGDFNGFTVGVQSYTFRKFSLEQ